MGIATTQDFYAHGLTAEMCAAKPRSIVAVSPAADTLTIPSHGMPEDTPFRFESNGALPAPLVAGRVYYVLPVADADDLIQVRETAGGPAVDITDEGDANATPSVLVQTKAILQRVLDAASARMVEDMSAHRGPVSRADCPEHVIAAICHEAAPDFIITAGLQRAGFADPQIAARAANAREQRARYRAGRPVDGLRDATPAKADNAAVTITPPGADYDFYNARCGGGL